jgi:hypothetical protein
VLKCDACSREITESEMMVKSGREVASKTKAGFVPDRIADGVVSAFGRSKADIWRNTVERNATAEWGFCRDCYGQLMAFGSRGPHRAATRTAAGALAQVKRWAGLLVGGYIALVLLVAGIAGLVAPGEPAKRTVSRPVGIVISALLIVLGGLLMVASWQRWRRSRR